MFKINKKKSKGLRSILFMFYTVFFHDYFKVIDFYTEAFTCSIF